MQRKSKMSAEIKVVAEDKLSRKDYREIEKA